MAKLFHKVKAGEQRSALIALLIHVANSLPQYGHGMGPREIADKIEKAEPGLMFVDPGFAPDAAGNVRLQLTEKGIAAAKELQSAPVVSSDAATPAPTQTFEILKGVPVPESKRGGGLRPSLYPFDKMGLGDSFFLAATTESPNPERGMSSNVSSFNKRDAATHPQYKGKDAAGNKIVHPMAGQSTGKQGRMFVSRPRKVGDPISENPNGPRETAAGVRVWRVK